MRAPNAGGNMFINVYCAKKTLLHAFSFFPHSQTVLAPFSFLFLFSHTHNVSTFRKTHTFACILIFSTHPDCACSFFILISFLAAKILMRRKMDQVCFEKLFPSKKKLKKSFSWKLFSFLSKLWKTFPLHVCKLFLLFCFILCLSFLFLYKSSFCENIIQCSCW